MEKRKRLIFWAPLLHIYQPPTQDIEILRKINKDSYKPLFSMLEKRENVKFCLNVNGVLIEMLYEFGLGDTVDLLKNLASENKIEILGTGKFHPILPLIPEKEANRQIILNEDVNRKEFGSSWKRTGFFPPEMAISPKIVKIVKDLGYKWMIMSGIACPVEWLYKEIYCSSNGLQLFFRDDILSNKISFKSITAEEFVEALKNMYKNDEKSYIITAMDGETFGHHIPNYERTFLGKVLELINEEQEIMTVFITELDRHFPINKKTIVPKESSWSTNNEDIIEKVPYPLWMHPDNSVHKYYWKIMKSLNNLMNLAEKLDLSQNWDVQNYCYTARYFFDRGLHSCPLWWANAGRGMWSPNLIYKGVELLLRAALNAQLALEYAGDDSGEGYFDSISYYHGLLLMELYAITKKSLKKKPSLNNNQ